LHWICKVHRCEHASKAPPLPIYVGADLLLTSPQPDISAHCKTTDTG